MLKLVRSGLEAIARRRVLKTVQAQIHPSSNVQYSGIGAVTGCRVEIGQMSIMQGKISFDREHASVKIGDRSFVGMAHLVAAESIEIGNDVMISWGVTVVDHNSHALNARDRLPDIPAWREGKKDWSKVMIAPVRIRDNAWIGFNAIILKGVTVGRGAVVSAGAVVAQDVPDYAVVMGNPARVLHFTEPL